MEELFDWYTMDSLARNHDGIICKERLYILNHIFLPPRLPQGDDYSPLQVTALLERTLDSLVVYKSLVAPDIQIHIETSIALLRNFIDIHQVGQEGLVIQQSVLKAKLQNLCDKGGCIPLHVSAQNAGILISKVDQCIHFELFELSPLNEAVIQAKGRLQRRFPGHAVSINASICRDASFQDTLTVTISKLSHQVAACTLPKSKKMGRHQTETRDTIDPKLVTGLLSAFLLGSSGTPQKVPVVWKNTREEVLHKNAEKAWHRSSVWLLVRVVLQLTFGRSKAALANDSAQSPIDLYKEFMVFNMARILEESQSKDLESDHFSIMTSKISRRLRKLGHGVHDSVRDYVHQVISSTNGLLSERWKSIQAHCSPNLPFARLRNLDFSQDTLTALPELDAFIHSIGMRRKETAIIDFQPRYQLKDFKPDEIPIPFSISGEYGVFDLAAVECWVETKLDQWLQGRLTDPNTSRSIHHLMMQYHQEAKTIYAENPEGTSIMILTILELWIACDKSAVNICSLLRDYELGFRVPMDIVQNLLLPFKSQMVRLEKVERYLFNRITEAKDGMPCVFSSFGSKLSFSVRYFDMSILHQSLLARIEKDAEAEKQRKIQEFIEKMKTYKELMRLHDNSSCDYVEILHRKDGSVTHSHKSNCTRCAYHKDATRIKINLHEWPLPSEKLKAKSTVFELQLPAFFSHWRETTLFLLLNVLDMTYTSTQRPKHHYGLPSYPGLQRYFQLSLSGQRIYPLSAIKPYAVTHYKSKEMSSICTVEEILMPNALEYNYYDGQKCCFIRAMAETPNVPQQCTYKMPSQSASLQQFLFRPAAQPNGLSPNTVIAQQHICPDHLSTNEFNHLCLIPFGSRLSWQNILRELFQPSINFKKAETRCVISQCIHQAGRPIPDEVLRENHVILKDIDFANRLLEGLLEASSRLEKNWQSLEAFNIFISLAKRLLSLASDANIANGCIQFLARARTTTLSWSRLLKDKASLTQDEKQRSEFQEYAVFASLICVRSFDLDDEYLLSTLQYHQNTSIFLECCINIQEGTNQSKPQNLLFWQWKRLCYRFHPVLAAHLIDDSRALDSAIQACWSAYRPQLGWKSFSDSQDNWLVRVNQNEQHGTPASVYFDLLTGELLVNGLPLGRPPSEYENHSTYLTFFGKSSIEVMPSDEPGFSFSSKGLTSKYSVHFGLQNENLIMRASNENATYELIPPQTLSGHLPTAFVEQYVHWYNMTDKGVEFRSKNDPWGSVESGWTLNKDAATGKWRLGNSTTSIVALGSPTADTIGEILSPLEIPSQIHCILSDTQKGLEIELPRVQLRFMLQREETTIKSKEFRGYIIDENQDPGTLIGLRNKLVLCTEANMAERVIVVPEGCISYRRDGHQIDVTIQRESDAKIHAYDLDNLLRTLRIRGPLHSRLFLAHLHAVTSFVLPDPFTLKTGTETALSMLKSAAVRSFSALSEKDIATLSSIADLTPKRKYYPSHLRVMQTLQWSPNISFLAQHNEFYVQVESIFDQACQSKLFYPTNWIEPRQLPEVSKDLLERDSIRSSIFRVWGFGAESHTCEHDTMYEARDRGLHSPEMIRAFEISTILYERHLQPSLAIHIDLVSHIWRFLSSACISVDDHTVSDMEIGYDSRWLLSWRESTQQFFTEHWRSLHRSLTSLLTVFDKYQLMIWLSTLAFGENPDMTIIHIICMLFNHREAMSIVSIPTSTQNFSPGSGFRINHQQLTQSIWQGKCNFDQCPEAKEPRHAHESNKAYRLRRQRLWNSSLDRSVQSMVSYLQGQWPCEVPQDPDQNQREQWSTYIRINKAMGNSQVLFKRWHDNLRFHEYLKQMSHLIPTTTNPIAAPPNFDDGPRQFQIATGCVTTDDVFRRRPSVVPKFEPTSFSSLLTPCATETSEINASGLSTLLHRLKSRASSDYERSYTQDLEESLKSLKNTRIVVGKAPIDLKRLEGILASYAEDCEEKVTQAYQTMLRTVSAQFFYHETDFENGGCAPPIAVDIYQWPRFSPTFFLEQLSQARWEFLPDGWKDYLIYYGLTITELQRAKRLRKSCQNMSQTELARELQNIGHTNWNPRDYPEYLLLEIESNIMIRAVQQQIACKMRDPPTGQNAVMQLNMGEGKSSVIVPMVTTALANGTQLVRVIVAKPQAKQMFHMLVSKLGGLLNRRIFHMPFSRAIKVGALEAKSIQNMFELCKRTCGVLLVQPEHILSFQLMGIEHAIRGEKATSRLLLHSHKYLLSSCRDIVDESDENFSTKFELVYTIGTQRPVDHSPERWACIQDLLTVFRRCIAKTKAAYPQGVESYSGPKGCFPRTRILQKDAVDFILFEIAKTVCMSGLKGFPISGRDEAIQTAVRTYISDPTPSKTVVDQVEHEGCDGFWAESNRNTLLLLRGLIAGGVLGFVFGQKRWRIDYGLDSSRSPNTNLAVPYRAKDQPSARSEFSHPDVIIILTSLSYYYEGLSDNNLRLAISHLLHSTQADSEYEAWVRDSDQLPQAFRHLSGLNLGDRTQCTEELYPCLRFSKAAIDYFLANIVFPKEMREFPHKLSASGWDIGETRDRPTTGFSGTRDSENVLPLSIKQLNLEEQKHTNALVLNRLLQSENSVALIPPIDEQNGQTNVDLLLNLVVQMEPAVRVILDVGAQILELDNLEVAKKWLNMLQEDERTQAAIFFDAEDNICVVDRRGRIEPFYSSPFAAQTDLCLVFLDEAHTRGIDLRLPEHYRAAVTLGANLTKDRLVQACMRMRKLGHGQSIVFCVHEEIQRKIQLLGPSETRQSPIEVGNVLEWAISETWRESRRNMPVWATQGRRYQRQIGTWSQIRGNSGIRLSKEQAEGFLESESQSVEARYRPNLTSSDNHLPAHDTTNINDEILKRCQKAGVLRLGSATFLEEQERELAPEVEEEREVQRPDPAQPLNHQVHTDVKEFIRTGEIPPSSEQFLEAFLSLKNSSAAKYLKSLTNLPRGPKVTVDFQRTVQSDSLSFVSDSYQRPVQWILTTTGRDGTDCSTGDLVIISPFEAQELLPAIQDSKYVALHIYAPLINPEYRSLDTLDLYTVPNRAVLHIPPPLVTGLKLFSGQLYFKSPKETEEVRSYLSHTNAKSYEQGMCLQTEGNGIGMQMNEDLVGLLRVLMMKIRRNCESIGKTHVGYILDERRLCVEDFPRKSE